MEINWPAIGIFFSAALALGNFVYMVAVMRTEQKTQGREIRDMKNRQDAVDVDLRKGGEQRAGMAANIETMLKQLERIENKLDRES